MKRYWEQLKPGERRVVATIGLIFFLVLNWLFIWPHFSDWGKAEARMKKAHDTMDMYNNEIKNRPIYDAKIRTLQNEGSSDVTPEDQAIDIVHFYTSRAGKTGVQVINNSRLVTRTNDPFFIDHEMQLTLQGRESQIVNFLYSLGAGNSIVRVRAMSLRPDGPHQQINANVSIVASYAKKPPARGTTPAAAPASVPAPAPTVSKPPAQTNKPLVAMTHNSAATNKLAPLNAKRP